MKGLARGGGSVLYLDWALVTSIYTLVKTNPIIFLAYIAFCCM